MIKAFFCYAPLRHVESQRQPEHIAVLLVGQIWMEGIKAGLDATPTRRWVSCGFTAVAWDAAPNPHKRAADLKAWPSEPPCTPQDFQKRWAKGTTAAVSEANALARMCNDDSAVRLRGLQVTHSCLPVTRKKCQSLKLVVWLEGMQQT